MKIQEFNVLVAVVPTPVLETVTLAFCEAFGGCTVLDKGLGLWVGPEGLLSEPVARVRIGTTLDLPEALALIWEAFDAADEYAAYIETGDGAAAFYIDAGSALEPSLELV